MPVSMFAIPQAKTPRLGAKWHDTGRHHGLARIWHHVSGVVVLSECSPMLIDGMDIVTPQWLVSVSGPGGKRPNNNQLAMVRRDFDMWAAEEDNHEPGIARKLFLIVDPMLRAQHAVCACKTDETLHVEEDRYRWSEAKSR
jgi:hypothetical protein